jgi:hypothetical protein
MVPDISPTRLLMLFTEGLLEPLRAWVKAFKPPNLQEAIGRTRDLMGSTTKIKFTPKPPINQGAKDQRGVDRGKGRMDEATVDDYNCVRHSPRHRPEREPMNWVCGSYLRQNWNAMMASSLQRVEKNSR